MNSKVNSLIIYFLILLPFSAVSQKHNIQEIDSIFASWNSPNHPGGSVLITQNGNTLFSKAYGLASIEYNVSNFTNTHFNIGSISKQFTALGIVLLEQRHMLLLDEDVVKYLPELPDFGHKITIRHLLHHTSGLRDIHGLLALAGWRRNDLETNEDLYRIIKNQKELNFKPGDEFLYSNTGYILLAKIIENVTSMSFDRWMQQNIFEPLEMSNTYVETQYNRVAKNNATSYYSGNEFSRALPYWGYFGAGNIHSTTEDVGIWLQNFTNPKEEWRKPFNRLLSTTPLNNGFNNLYAFGVRVENYLGKKIIQHGGAVGGFRSIVRTFPNEKLNIVILSNFSDSNIYSKVNKISELILGKNKEEVAAPPIEPKSTNGKIIALPIDKLKEFEGVYWSDTEKIGREVYVKNDTLRYSNSANSEWALIPIGNRSFKMVHPYPNFSPMVDFNNNGQMMIKSENSLPGLFTFLQPIQETNTNDLNRFEGLYYSTELKSTYSIVAENNKISIKHARHGDIKMKRLYNNIFSGEWPLGIVELSENKAGNIEGLRISNGRTRNVWFKKIK
jgi:CubicO group peptidase (beta-lactamase class C family)